MEVLLIVVVGTSLWVLIDSSTIGVRKGAIRGFFDMGPVGWFFSCLLLWIVAFPAYLVKREQYKKAKDSARGVSGAKPDDIPAQIRRLAELRAEGLITEEEFQAKKRDLMSRM